MSTKVLFVDDDPNILAGFQRNLRKEFSLDTAQGGEQGLELIDRHGPYAVIVADMQMPGMNGIQFLIKVEERAADSVRIMLTGNADQKTARDAVNQGHIFRFLTKPCLPEELTLALKAGLRQYALVTAERDLLERTLNGSVKMLSEILSMLDPQAFGNGQRLREYMRTFAQSFKICQTWDLELAAMLSQIGWVTVPPSIQEKARTGHGLTGQEKDILARMPQIAGDLLGNIPRLESVASIIRFQDKNYDGTGFPTDAISGDSIPIGARILHVLKDLLAFESLKHSKLKALEGMRQSAGKYDPKVLEAVAACFDVYLAEQPSNGSNVVAIDFKDLRVGAVLKSDLVTNEGTLVAVVGTEISPTLLEKLRNFDQLSGIKQPIHIEKLQ